METYVILLEFTDKGREQVGDLSAGREAFEDLIGDSDVELHEVLLTMGRFDGVAIVEAADADTLADVLLEYAEQGVARTETLRAFPAEEYL